MAAPRRFSDDLISAFIEAVVEWTREHHPERLERDPEPEPESRGELRDEMFQKQ